MRALVLVFAVAACGSSAHNPDAAPIDVMPDASPWTTVSMTPAPGARLLPSVAALGDRMVMADGFDANLKILTEIDVYDTIAGTWSQLPDAPVAWTHGDLASAGGSLYFLGGLETDNFDVNGSSYVLDATATAWTPLAPMPTGLERGAAGVAVNAPYIYIIGGGQQNTSIATCLRYDISNDTWTQLPDLPGPRSHPGVAILPDGTLIATGGLQTIDSTMPIADTVALPVDGTAWEPRAPMPTARGGMACGLFGDRFVCAGGEANNLAISKTEAYDWTNDTWSELAPMPVPRAGTQGAAIGTRLFAPGGAYHIQYNPVASMDILTVLQ